MTTSPELAGRTRRAQAHRGSVQVEVYEVVRFLKESLGLHLVALMVDRDPHTVTRWADGAQRPKLDSERKLRGAYQIFLELQSAESPHTIRAWFMGMNPQLEDESPAEAIAKGRIPEVMAAARAFASGG